MPLDYGAYQIDPFRGFNEGLANIGKALQYRRETERQRMLDAENKRLRDLQVKQANLGIERTEAENLGTIGAYSEEGKPPLTLADAIAMQKKKEIEARELDQVNKRITNYLTVGKSLKGTSEQKNKVMREWLSKDPNPLIQRIAPSVELEGDKVKYTVTITGNEKNPDGSPVTNPDGSPIVPGIYDVEGEATGEPKNPVRIIESKRREEKVKEYQPKLFVRPDGSLDWVKPGEPIPKGWVDASEKGFSVEFDPESKSFKIIQGPAGMIGQMAKPTQTKIETGILDAKEQLARIDSISEEFKPEYQEIGSRLGASWTGLKAKFGQGISETDTKFLIEFKKYQRKSIENINKYIKEITGAAMSEAEANRLRLAQPDPGEKWYQGDDPITFKAKLDDITKMTKLSLARYQMYLNQGMNDKQIKSLIQANKVVSIESVEDIMRKRSFQIIQSLKGTDINEEEARKIAKEQLKREFGL